MFRRLSMMVFAGWMCAMALTAIISSVAHASCGDWLQHRVDGISFSSVVRASGIRGDQTLSIPEVESRDSPGLPWQVPCHGPHCSEAPHQPLPPVPAAVPVRSEHAGLAASAETTRPASLQFGDFPELPVRSAKGFLRRPDHPPRV